MITMYHESIVVKPTVFFFSRLVSVALSNSLSVKSGHYGGCKAVC